MTNIKSVSILGNYVRKILLFKTDFTVKSAERYFCYYLLRFLERRCFNEKKIQTNNYFQFILVYQSILKVKYDIYSNKFLNSGISKYNYLALLPLFLQAPVPAEHLLFLYCISDIFLCTQNSSMHFHCISGKVKKKN